MDSDQNTTETTSMGGFFITGTDTDVGKTFVSGCIATNLIQAGKNVAPRKPIASGCIRQTDGSLLAEDALFLQNACQSDDSLDKICPYQFEPAVSPHTAIKRANLSITLSDLALGCRTSDEHFTLVEGAGGFYSPIARDGLNKDLAVLLDHPVILVVANKLGCINQTLLSIEAIKSAGLRLHSIIINQVAAGTERDHSEGLTDFTDSPIFAVNYSENGQPFAITDWQINLVPTKVNGHLISP